MHISSINRVVSFALILAWIFPNIANTQVTTTMELSSGLDTATLCPQECADVVFTIDPDSSHSFIVDLVLDNGSLDTVVFKNFTSGSSLVICLDDTSSVLVDTVAASDTLRLPRSLLVVESPRFATRVRRQPTESPHTPSAEADADKIK